MKKREKGGKKCWDDDELISMVLGKASAGGKGHLREKLNDEETWDLKI